MNIQQTPQNSIQPGASMTVDDFHNSYWFNTLQMIEVINPLTYDWPFMVEGRHFVVKEGSKERLPGAIANIYLDQVSKIMAQDDDKLGFMADPNLKKLYYDKLIINVDSMVQEAFSVPGYLKPQPLNHGERAPWDASLGERASNIPRPIAPLAPALPTPPAPTEPDRQPGEPKAATKSFDLGEDKYKFITAKDGRKMYYKNGGLTNVAEYNRAASML